MNGELKAWDTARQYAARSATAALALCGFGIYLQIQANIGIAPWHALNQGVANTFPVTFGTACNVIAAFVVLADLLLGEPIGFGTLLDALVVGWTTDICAALGLVPAQTKLPLQILCLLAGMLAICVGQRFYMGTALGCGPRDALLVALGKRFRRVSIGVVNLGISAVVVTAAYLLGAPIGLGTLITVCFTGVMMDAVFYLLRFDAYSVRHESVLESLRTLRGGGKSA